MKRVRKSDEESGREREIHLIIEAQREAEHATRLCVMRAYWIFIRPILSVVWVQSSEPRAAKQTDRVLACNKRANSAELPTQSLANKAAQICPQKAEGKQRGATTWTKRAWVWWRVEKERGRDERKSKRVREKTNSRHTFQFALLGPDLMPLDAMQTRHMNHAVENPHTDAVPFFPLLMAITIERERGSGRLGRDKMITYVQAAEPSWAWAN